MKKTKLSNLWHLKGYFLDEYDENIAVLRPDDIDTKDGGFKRGAFLVNKLKLPKLVQELMEAEFERGQESVLAPMYKKWPH